MTEKEHVQITCKNNDRIVSVPQNTSLSELFRLLQPELPGKPLCARVNNKTEELGYRLFSPKEVEFLTVAHPSGMRTYVRSLCYVLFKAVKTILPKARLRIEHSVSKGYFCILDEWTPVESETIAAIKAEMQRIIARDLPFEKCEVPTPEAIETFRERGMYDRVALLESSQTLYTTYYRLGELVDTYYSCLVPSTGYLSTFDLIRYDSGMLLLPPRADNPAATETVAPQPKMLEVFKEAKHFNSVAHLDNVGELNRVILRKEASTLIQVAEALQEKRIVRIAEIIADRHARGAAKVILISGPSSSGKTTFSKRLGIQLMTNLLRPVTISLDDYFVDREQTPRDENGDFDYESLYALDLALFNDHLARLVAGEEIDVPCFNFERGCREYRGNRLRLTEGSVLVLEGIHALNPELTTVLPDHQKFRIYVSALTSLSIDDHNWIPTTDNRLLRRIIRDHKYRGSDASGTIARWPSVRRGEDRWIFPYQENADALFNSALLFELAVVKQHAEPVLKAVPRTHPAYSEAHRLLTFLDYILPVEEREIPPTSLLREFLGGSSFTYS